MLDSKGFDLWADGYDKSVNLSEENNEYPFAGYKGVLNYIYSKVRESSSSNVLDIGFGTGVLTTQLYNDGYGITGIDFSSSMIDIAKDKMPDAVLINWDFSKGLPNEIAGHKYDYIISTYAIHHLSDEAKVEFIKALTKLLNTNGKILIGDVSFETSEELNKCRELHKEDWDNDEFYFVANNIMNSLNDLYYCNYDKISHCAGVLVVENIKSE
ncbi:class I SAM-dependent methyltransferase [Sedimentibacter hydroxybenzoicus DSM 7310]|uniref:Class I SAM-dependent methyltransferase n=1 Tax=Sedimentibacter hydroxybenzoicus DSM 7310 TaxID=1123245 RepID=A0A974BKL8_SEDHY|nr:class I SAM-dependent methyltransferase [Sedimentibacter hydroxybenzoicus]NYB74899.1 class I SAM-dependent methyltransferase [Sedimentibacter hydroxybenzoicus DSM 7310]